MCCKMLLASSSAKLINSKDKDGNTALHLASANGFKDVVKVLCDNAGCNPNLADSNGRTPLHWAAACSFLPVAKVLLAAQVRCYFGLASQY